MEKKKKVLLEMMKKNKGKEEGDKEEIDETIVRLSDCFKYIYINLYKIEDLKVRSRL